MVFYISGPITGHTDYLEKFDAAEQYLRERGHKAINPARLANPLKEQGIEIAHSDWLQIDETYLKYADAVLMLDGWEKSQGALYEYKMYQLYSRDKGEHENIYFWNKKEVIPWQE